jgi:hypothetical protein
MVSGNINMPLGSLMPIPHFGYEKILGGNLGPGDFGTSHRGRSLRIIQVRNLYKLAIIAYGRV